MNVKIYTTPTCGYCHQAKGFLDSMGVDYTEYDVSRDRAAADEMVKLTGQMGVPVIAVDGQVVIGFDRQRLQALLAGGGRRNGPRLGLKVTDADRARRQPGEPPLLGAIVGGVSSGMAGERAGIRAGDVITSIASQRINNTGELERIMSTLSGGSRVPVTYYRGEKAIKAELAL